MDNDRVLSGIQRRARLHGPHETGRAVRAVLRGLSEVLPATAFLRIVVRLPASVRSIGAPAAADAPPVTVRAFVSGIAQRLHVDEPEAAFLARVVFENLNAATHGVTPSTVAYLAPVGIRPLLNAHAPDAGTTRPLPAEVGVPESVQLPELDVEADVVRPIPAG